MWGDVDATTAGVLMVVPVPNKHGMGEADFVLSAVEHKDVEDMRYGLGNIFEKYGSFDISFDFLSRASGGRMPPLTQWALVLVCGKGPRLSTHG